MKKNSIGIFITLALSFFLQAMDQGPSTQENSFKKHEKHFQEDAASWTLREKRILDRINQDSKYFIEAYLKFESVPLEALKEFLKSGRYNDLSSKCAKKEVGRFFLINAIDRDAFGVVKMLLESDLKESLNTANEYGETPLFSAVRAGNTRMVELLLQSGALPNYINNEGKNPLDILQEEKKMQGREGDDLIEALLYSVELVPRELVIKEKVEKKETSFKDRFDAMLLKDGNLRPLRDERKQFIEARLSIYDLLKTKPTDQERDYTLTPLQKKIKHDAEPFSIRDLLLKEKKEHEETYQEKVKSVLKQAIVSDAKGVFTVVRRGFPEIPITYKDTEGYTLLHWAAIKNRVYLAEDLLGLGIPVDEPDNNGRTPFMFAVSNGHKEMAELLLKKGAMPNVQAHNNFEVRFKDGTSLIIEKGDNMSDVLQGRSVVFGEKGGKGRTALQLLIRMVEGSVKKHGKQLEEEKAIPLIELLMHAGADMYVEDFPWGLTPLDWIIHNNQEKLFDALVAGRKKQLGIIDVIVPKNKKTNDKGKGKA